MSSLISLILFKMLKKKIYPSTFITGKDGYINITLYLWEAPRWFDSIDAVLIYCHG